MTASRDDLITNAIQFAADRLIVQPIADPDDHPAEQLGIDLRFEERILLKCLVQFLSQALALIVRQRYGRTNQNAQASGFLFAQLPVSRGNHSDKVESL